MLVNNDLDFPIPLLNGMFNSAVPIPLGQNDFRGLMVQLELAPDSMVLFGTGSTANPNLTGAKHELRDLSLSYDLLIPDETTRAGMAVPASGSIAYNSVTSLFSVRSTPPILIKHGHPCELGSVPALKRLPHQAFLRSGVFFLTKTPCRNF